MKCLVFIICSYCQLAKSWSNVTVVGRRIYLTLGRRGQFGLYTLGKLFFGSAELHGRINAISCLIVEIVLLI